MSKNHCPSVMVLIQGRDRMDIPFRPGMTLEEWLKIPTVKIMMDLDPDKEWSFLVDVERVLDPACVPLRQGMLITPIEKLWPFYRQPRSSAEQKVSVEDLRNDPRIMKHGVLTDQAADVLLEGGRMAGFLPDDLAKNPVLKSLVKNVLGAALLNMKDLKSMARPCDYCGGSGKVNFGLVRGEVPCKKCNA